MKTQADILALHARACEAKQAGYMDPNSGLFVMTSYGLEQRGFCCGNGCRHCPWPEAEQRRAGRDMHTPSYPWPAVTERPSRRG